MLSNFVLEAFGTSRCDPETLLGSDAEMRLAPIQTARMELAMTSLNEFIFVAGGMDASDTPLSSVSKYSLETNTWTEVKEMNEARRTHELVTLNGEIYAIGGNETNTVECYNPSTNEWRFVTPTKNQSDCSGAVSYLNKIYVLNRNGFEVFDPQSKTWQDLPELNIGYGAKLVPMNDKLWAVGGGKDYENYITASKTVYEFDINNNSWRKLLEMDVARILHQAVVVNL